MYHYMLSAKWHSRYSGLDVLNRGAPMVDSSIKRGTDQFTRYSCLNSGIFIHEYATEIVLYQVTTWCRERCGVETVIFRESPLINTVDIDPYVDISSFTLVLNL